MRYMIMDTMLDFGSVYILMFIVTWILHSCYTVVCAWWKEGQEDLKVQELEKDDLRLEEIKAWRG